MEISTILNPVIMLFIAIFIGLIGAKTGYLPLNIKDALSKIIINVTLPLFIFTSLLSKEFTAETAKGAVIAMCSAVVVMIILYILGLLSAKLFKMKDPTKTLHAVLTASGNIGFMGYPVVMAVFGVDALFYAVIYGLTNDALFWSAGVYLVNKSSGQKSSKAALKKLINPNTIVFAVTIPLLILGVKLPAVIHEALSGIGSLTTYLAMLFIGMVLATVDIKKIYKRVTMLAPVLLKMIIAPVITGFILFNIGVNPIIIGAVVLEVAMPAQTVTSIVANEAGSDTTYAAEYIFLSTVFSLVTLPFVYWCLEKIMM